MSSKITKKSILVFLCFFMVSNFQHVRAQVKVGDNPGTINANSILEMESTDKGVLVPRVVLNNLASEAPLSAPVEEGMLIYSNGGSVTDGFYYWTGAAWAQIAASASTRDNHVLVKSVSDFPTASGGIITLAANTVYEINGTITLSDRIDMNGSYLIGQNVNSDRLIYTGASELLTGNKGGTVKILTLVASTGSVFNLDATSNPGQTFIIRDCIVASSANVGIIKGYNVVFVDVVNFAGNASGITYENINTLLLNNTAWFTNNAGTYETLVGTFSDILKLGGIMQVPTGAVGVDITGIVSIIATAAIKNTAFSGTGTYINGSFSNEWEVDAGGIETVSDNSANGSIYISTSSLTTISAINTPVKVAGTTTAVNLDRMTSPVDNRLLYTGTKTRKFEVLAAISFTASQNQEIISFYLAKNGTTLTQTRQQRKTAASSDVGAISLSGIIELQPNDYVEVWVENNSGNGNVTIKFMNMDIK